jgi:hypothetical protein
VADGGASRLSASGTDAGDPIDVGPASAPTTVPIGGRALDEIALQGQNFTVEGMRVTLNLKPRTPTRLAAVTAGSLPARPGDYHYNV